jgi:hypothetical protein
MTMRINYEKSLQRAHDENLEICLDKTDRDGVRLVGVRHPDDPTGFYTVRWYPGSRQLVCNCEAARHGISCKHRALVHEYFTRKIAERDAKRAAADEQAEVDSDALAERRNEAWFEERGHGGPDLDEYAR